MEEIAFKAKVITATKSSKATSAHEARLRRQSLWRTSAIIYMRRPQEVRVVTPEAFLKQRIPIRRCSA